MDFSWSGIEFEGDVIQVILGEAGQVGSLGQVLAQQAVGVFVRSALPWAVRIGEVHLDAGALGQLLVSAHFLALVVGQRLAHGLVHAIERLGEASQGGLGGAALHAGQHDQAAGTLHQRAHGGTVGCPLDEVALPMSGHQAVFDFVGTGMQAGHVGNPAAPVFPARTGTAPTPTVTQAGDQLGAQRPARHHVQGVVEGFVGNGTLPVLGPDPLECARDLLRRPAFPEVVLHHAKQHGVRRQLGRASGLEAHPSGPNPGSTGVIAAHFVRVARQLPADRGRRATQRAGHGPHAAPLSTHQHQCRPLFSTQLFVFVSHRNTLTRCCT
jgi:hypothetical protein